MNVRACHVVEFSVEVCQLRIRSSRSARCHRAQGW